MDNEPMGGAAAADAGANDEYDRPKVHYVCGGKLAFRRFSRSRVAHTFLSSTRLREGQHAGQGGDDSLPLLQLSHFLQEARQKVTSVRSQVKARSIHFHFPFPFN